MTKTKQSPPKRVFLVRQVTALEYAFEQHAEEAAFDSYDKALCHVRRIVREYAVGRSRVPRSIAGSPRTYIEIVSYCINDRFPWKRWLWWTFDKDGSLIRAPKPETRRRRFDPEAFTGKFKVGDIVFVRALPWNEGSHFAVDHVGVIAWSPVPFNLWLAKGKPKDEWDGVYAVDFINSDGYLDHDHVCESAIKRYRRKLPDELSFLKTLSAHYLGRKPIKKSVLPSLYQSGISVRKVRHFGKDCIE
jgi:hypothetical protein